MRKLRFSERKLLKKVDFLNWKVDNNLHETKIMRRYHIQRREDYTAYPAFLFPFLTFGCLRRIPISLFLAYLSTLDKTSFKDLGSRSLRFAQLVHIVLL